MGPWRMAVSEGRQRTGLVRRDGQTERQDSVPLWKLRKRMTKMVAVLSYGFWAERTQETDTAT